MDHWCRQGIVNRLVGRQKLLFMYKMCACMCVCMWIAGWLLWAWVCVNFLDQYHLSGWKKLNIKCLNLKFWLKACEFFLLGRVNVNNIIDHLVLVFINLERMKDKVKLGEIWTLNVKTDKISLSILPGAATILVTRSLAFVHLDIDDNYKYINLKIFIFH